MEPALHPDCEPLAFLLGTWRGEGQTIDVASTSVSTTTTGSPVTVLDRHLEVRGDRLSYELHMAMHEVAVMRHLTAELIRV